MSRLFERKYEQGVSARDRDMLPAADRERYRPGSDLTAGLKLPQRFARRRVERVEVPLVRSAEHEAARGRQHARPRRRRQLEIPHLLPRLDIDRAHGAPGFLVEPLLAAAGVVGAGLVLDRRL